jgi:hypothetical protein
MVELDKNGNPFTRDTIFSERIPNELIKSRSVVLGGLMDGLSLRGKRDASIKLEEGSELSSILGPVPLEAVAKILFARPRLCIPVSLYTSYSLHQHVSSCFSLQSL